MVDEIDIIDEPVEPVETVKVRSFCPLGLPDGSPGSHADHDAKIRELVEMLQERSSPATTDRTHQILAIRIKKLERGIKIIMGWLPKERQTEIEQKLSVHR